MAEPPPDPAGPPKQPGDIADLVTRRIASAIVIAGAAIALAIYARPSPPRYQLVAGEGEVVRLDTRSGSMIACDGTGCTSVHRRGQDVGRRGERRLFEAPPAAQQPALPAPRQQPAQPQPQQQPSPPGG